MRPTAELVIEFAEGLVTGANVSHLQEHLNGFGNLDVQETERKSMNEFLNDLHHFRLGQDEPNWKKETDRLFYKIMVYRLLGVFTANPTQVGVDLLQRENSDLRQQLGEQITKNKEIAALLKDAIEGKKVTYRG